MRSFYMSKRSPKSVEEKCDIVQLLIKGERSVSQLAKQYRIAGTTVKRWRDKYQQYGICLLYTSKQLFIKNTALCEIVR
ncbi:hypothetical protein RO09_07860 [Streptococcus sobrinus]|nr:hypothetical protein RO09_07860 [Streptococcus sobrinus]